MAQTRNRKKILRYLKLQHGFVLVSKPLILNIPFSVSNNDLVCPEVNLTGRQKHSQRLINNYLTKIDISLVVFPFAEVIVFN